MRLTLAMVRALVGVGVLLFSLLIAPGIAQAYPQFQFSTGASRCMECHVSPTGGGLLSDYGRGELGDTISAGGDGSFLHGAWTPPSWFQLGGDIRVAGLAKSAADQESTAVFPMQADIYARIGGERVAFNITIGARGAARDAGRSVAERLASREHYLQVQPSSRDWYVRAGRFQPVIGLRSQDHTSSVKRHFDQYLLEEPYGIGVGYFGGRTEAHVAAYVPRPIELLGAGRRAMGVTAYVERMVGDSGAVGGQARVARSDADTTYLAGAVGKWFMPEAELMVLAELDLQLQAFADGGDARGQLGFYLGASKWLRRGLMLTGAVHRWDPDLQLHHAHRDAAELNLQWFPWAHVELHLLGRASAPGGNYDQPEGFAMLQAHYTL